MPDEIIVVATAVNTALTAAAIVLAIRFVLASALLEVFRQRLFAVRRELFLQRVDGHVSPDDPAYQILMRQINGSIRFAESFTFGRLFVFWAFLPREERSSVIKNDRNELKNAISASPSRELLERYLERFGFETVRHLALSSPFAWVFMAIFVPIAIVIGFKAKLGRAARHLGSRPAVEQLQLNAGMLFDADVATAS